MSISTCRCDCCKKRQGQFNILLDSWHLPKSEYTYASDIPHLHEYNMLSPTICIRCGFNYAKPSPANE